MCQANSQKRICNLRETFKWCILQVTSLNHCVFIFMHVVKELANMKIAESIQHVNL